MIEKNERYFENQMEDEKILLVLRQHHIVLVPLIFAISVIYIIGIAVAFFLPNYFPVLAEGSVPNFLYIGLSLYFLFSSLYFFIEWVMYYLQVNIITSESAVDINQKSLFSREIMTLSLEDVEDVTATQKGFIQTMLNFGDVQIQTAGERPNFNFERIKNPYEVQKKVMELKEQFYREFRKVHTGNFVPRED